MINYHQKVRCGDFEVIQYQTENIGNQYEYRSNPHENWVIAPHIHQFSEIAFTKKGTTTVFVDGQKFRVPENHLIFILPDQIHEYSDETYSQMRCAVFSDRYIPAFLETVKDSRLLDPVIDLTAAPQLLEQLDRTSPTDTLMLCGLLNLLCARLLHDTALVPRSTVEKNLFRDAIGYIRQNFQQDIGLRDVAKELGYHEKYLSSALHGLTGTNFRTFLASYRVDHAKRLLRRRDGSHLRISDIAQQSGFSSINSFNRAFLKITGMTPTQYRSVR